MLQHSRSITETIIELFLGYIVLTIIIVMVIRPIMYVVPGLGIIAIIVFYGYILGGALYVQELRSVRDGRNMWRRKGTITILVFVAVAIGSIILPLIMR